MKIHELISILQQRDPEMIVVIDRDIGEFPLKLDEITETDYYGEKAISF